MCISEGLSSQPHLWVNIIVSWMYGPVKMNGKWSLVFLWALSGYCTVMWMEILDTVYTGAQGVREQRVCVCVCVCACVCRMGVSHGNYACFIERESVRVCVCVCVVCACDKMRVWAPEHNCLCVGVCLGTCVFLHVWMHAFAFLHVCVCVCLCVSLQNECSHLDFPMSPDRFSERCFC